MERILPGEVAWYVTGRFYAGEDGSLFDAGYFLHLQGIDAPMFAGAPGEQTARFTFLANPFTAKKVTNGGLSLALDSEGAFSVYLDRNPGGADFHAPASFGAGEEIARFRRVGVVTGATLSASEGGAPLVSIDVFSARLVWSREFEMDGRRHDLARLMPNGVTQWSTAAAASAGALPGYASVVPFVGSAIAIGGGEAERPRRQREENDRDGRWIGSGR